MKLSTKGKYGLIAMTYLGKHYNPKKNIYISLSDITKKNNISDTYLEFLIRKLKKAGYVKTQRGVFGGYSLTLSPKKIIISDLLSILEGPIDVCGCKNKSNKCYIYNTCVSRYIGEKITEKIKEVVNNITLNDLLKVKIYKKNKNKDMKNGK